MKQFTTPEQTVKLIELGFDKPRVAMPKFEWKDGELQFRYTIGELIEILGYDLYDIHYSGFSWEVKSEKEEVNDEELIDALFAMIVKLKEDGVI